MINISIWNNDTGNKKILSLCKSLLNNTFDEDLNLIYNKMYEQVYCTRERWFGFIRDL